MRQPGYVPIGSTKIELEPDTRLWLERMAEKGWTTPTWPREYGGAGLSKEEYRILIEELHNAGLYRDIQQAFVVLLPVQSVGVMGDDRTYENVAAIRAIQSEDFMTADWFRFPHEILQKISTRIINSVRGINRVVYDVSSKPPATIEWE